VSGPVLCRCGAVLLEDLSDSGVTPAGSDEAVRFRRTTDYVICSECQSVYRIDALRGGASVEESLVDKLEKLVEEPPDSAGGE
jgi:hypothetical protein